MDRAALGIAIVLAACAQGGDPLHAASSLAGPPVVVTPGVAAAGAPLDVVVAGLPVGTRVGVALGERLVSTPVCPAPAGGACIDVRPDVYLGEALVDLAGVARVRGQVPGSMTPGTAWLQAVVLGVVGQASAPRRIDVRGRSEDLDGDGVLDWFELVRGLDPDAPDSDADGQEDGEDRYPLVPDAPQVFVPDDPAVLPPGASLPDPEWDADSRQVVWQTAGGEELWVADVVDVVGRLSPPDGRGRLVDTDITPIAFGINGPEWALSWRGPEVVYVKEVGGVPLLHRAHETAAGWQAQPVAPGAEAVLAYGTKVVGDRDPSVTFFRNGAAGRPSAWWMALDDPLGTATRLPVFMGDARVVRGGFTIVGAAGRLAPRQITEVDPLTGQVTQLSQDPFDKYFTFAWDAPELGGERMVMAARDPHRLGVFTEVVAYRYRQGAWRPSVVVRGPASHPGVFSPELFVHQGRSYVSWQAESLSGSSDKQVWVASLDGTVLRRVSSATPAHRRDPEPYVWPGGVWVFYVELQGPDRVLHRAATGL